MNNYRLLYLALLLSIFIFKTIEINGQIADFVLINGQFHTVDAENSWAEAIAIEDGTIQYVGSMSDINTYIGSETEIIDLDGKFAMPAFVESHLHPLSTAYAHNFTAILYDFIFL